MPKEIRNKIKKQIEDHERISHEEFKKKFEQQYNDPNNALKKPVKSSVSQLSKWNVSEQDDDIQVLMTIPQYSTDRLKILKHTSRVTIKVSKESHNQQVLLSKRGMYYVVTYMEYKNDFMYRILGVELNKVYSYQELCILCKDLIDLVESKHY